MYATSNLYFKEFKSVFQICLVNKNILEGIFRFKLSAISIINVIIHWYSTISLQNQETVRNIQSYSVLYEVCRLFPFYIYLIEVFVIADYRVYS